MNNSISKRLEQYTVKRPQEVLLISVEIAGEEDQIAIFKGFSSSLTINQLESLLIKGNSLSLDQSKWYRDYKNSNVFIKNTTYDSKLTGNKRISVFDHNNLLVNTKPFNFKV